MASLREDNGNENNNSSCVGEGSGAQPTMLCGYFQQTGKCKYGNQCLFSHHINVVKKDNATKKKDVQCKCGDNSLVVIENKNGDQLVIPHMLRCKSVFFGEIIGITNGKIVFDDDNFDEMTMFIKWNQMNFLINDIKKCTSMLVLVEKYHFPQKIYEHLLSIAVDIVSKHTFSDHDTTVAQGSMSSGGNSLGCGYIVIQNGPVRRIEYRQLYNPTNKQCVCGSDFPRYGVTCHDSEMCVSCGIYKINGIACHNTCFCGRIMKIGSKMCHQKVEDREFVHQHRRSHNNIAEYNHMTTISLTPEGFKEIFSGCANTVVLEEIEKMVNLHMSQDNNLQFCGRGVRFFK